MNRYGLSIVIIGFLSTTFTANGAEEFTANPGRTSTGYITINLELTEDVTAGFLKTNLDDPDSRFNEQLSIELVQSIRNDTDATVPFCVISSGGGYFEITSFETGGSAVNNVLTNSPPLKISFGEDELSSIKYHSVVDECNSSTAIPVTINLNEQYSGQDVGRIHGKFNLLVKSE